MQAFKCDVCGKYFSSFSEDSVIFVEQDDTNPYKFHSIARIEYFDSCIDPKKKDWDLCLDCQNILNGLVNSMIRQKRKEFGS